MTALEPLIHPRLDSELAKTPNFGTVVDFVPYIGGFSQIKIGEWRQKHPDLKVFIAYGVHVTKYQDGKLGLGHGHHLAIQGREMTRYYWHAAGNECWDDLWMPRTAIANWDEGDLHRQLHFPAIKWFDPYYGFLNGKFVKSKMSRDELVEEIKRRVAAVSAD